MPALVTSTLAWRLANSSAVDPQVRSSLGPLTERVRGSPALPWLPFHSRLSGRRLRESSCEQGAVCLITASSDRHVGVSSTQWLPGKCWWLELNHDSPASHLGLCLEVAGKTRTPRSWLKEAVWSGTGALYVHESCSSSPCSGGRTLERLFCPGRPTASQQVEFIFVSMPQGCRILGSFCLVSKSQGLRDTLISTIQGDLRSREWHCPPFRQLPSLQQPLCPVNHPRYHLPERTLVFGPSPREKALGQPGSC